jgi:hypothetical protein
LGRRSDARSSSKLRSPRPNRKHAAISAEQKGIYPLSFEQRPNNNAKSLRRRRLDVAVGTEALTPRVVSQFEFSGRSRMDADHGWERATSSFVLTGEAEAASVIGRLVARAAATSACAGVRRSMVMRSRQPTGGERPNAKENGPISPSRPPGVAAVVRAASLACQNAVKAQKFVPLQESSEESRF